MDRLRGARGFGGSSRSPRPPPFHILLEEAGRRPRTGFLTAPSHPYKVREPARGRREARRRSRAARASREGGREGGKAGRAGRWLGRPFSGNAAAVRPARASARGGGARASAYKRAALAPAPSSWPRGRAARSSSPPPPPLRCCSVCAPPLKEIYSRAALPSFAQGWQRHSTGISHRRVPPPPPRHSPEEDIRRGFLRGGTSENT